MIRTVLRIHWTNLRRDRVAQLLTFVVPMAFFTVFALIFGGRGGAVTGRVHVAVVDESGTPTSARLVRALQAEKSLVVLTRARVAGGSRDTTRVPLDRARAEGLVRDGSVPLALVLPAGLDTSLARFDGGGAPLQMLSDPSDAIAPQVVGGLLQKIVMTAMPDLFMQRGVGQFERYAGGLTPQQRRAVDGLLPQLRARAERDAAGAPAARARASRDSSGAAAGPGADSARSAGLSELVKVEVVPVLGRKQDSGMISFYAAAIAVMFLLFTASAVAGTLLDEVDSGTLERVLSTRVGMTGLLAGKWTWLTLLGMIQITVMFVYGMLVFRLDLLHHLPGFAVMTLSTAATAAAFGLFLASMCRTRAQLGGVSLLVILVMSALGGSMFPRIFMTPGMQKAGLVTFNAWALDGYVKVFWREAPLTALLPQVGMLAGFLVVFLALARLFARRWERA
jgi:ABC-2 type transport system permease protein